MCNVYHTLLKRNQVHSYKYIVNTFRLIKQRIRTILLINIINKDINLNKVKTTNNIVKFPRRENLFIVTSNG